MQRLRWAIDPNNLAEECAAQPGMTRAAGVREADARHARDQAKSRLDVVEAEIAHEVRKDPEKFGIEGSPTIPEVKSAVVRDRRYQTAVAELNGAERELQLAGADVRAHTDRRKMIERLVELLQLDYFSEREPRVSDPAVRDAATRTRRKAVRVGMDRDDRG